MTISPNQIPPYVSHRTFTTFLESLNEGIPDRVDGSVFDASFSGTSRKQITSALKSLDLIDDELRPTARLATLVQSRGEERKTAWLELLQESYAPVFMLDLQTATTNQLREELRKIVRTESMLIKCESFFKHAAVEAGLKLSPHIMRRKQGPRRKRAESRVPKPDMESAQVATDAPVALPPTPVATPQSPSSGVWQLFPQFDPNWSEQERQNWLAAVAGVTNALEGRGADATMTDETSSDGAPD